MENTGLDGDRETSSDKGRQNLFVLVAQRLHSRGRDVLSRSLSFTPYASIAFLSSLSEFDVVIGTLSFVFFPFLLFSLSLHSLIPAIRVIRASIQAYRRVFLGDFRTIVSSYRGDRTRRHRDLLSRARALSHARLHLSGIMLRNTNYYAAGTN